MDLVATMIPFQELGLKGLLHAGIAGAGDVGPCSATAQTPNSLHLAKVSSAVIWLHHQGESEAGKGRS